MSKCEAADPVALAPRGVALRFGGGAKSFRVKMEGDLYAALRTYHYQRERATGTKLTDQQVIVEALTAFPPTKLLSRASDADR